MVLLGTLCCMLYLLLGFMPSLKNPALVFKPSEYAHSQYAMEMNMQPYHANVLRLLS